jgi:solute:Na+ symporter, SSS family
MGSGSHLHPVALGIVLLFMLGMLGMGWYFSRRQETSEDYYLAGRRMPWWAVGLSMLATLTSTISYLMMPGEMIRAGVGFFTGVLAYPLIAAFVIFVAIPFFMRLRLTSVYEYLEWRFDYRVRALGAALFVCILLGWMGTVVFTASKAVAEITGFNLVLVILVVGLISTAYTTMGGIRADIWTDVAQAVIMFGGTLFAIGYVAVQTHTGLPEWWATAARVEHTAVPLFSLDPQVRVTTFWAAANIFFWYICTCAGSQTAMQRFFTMSTVRAAQRSFVTNMVTDLILWVLLGITGVALLAFYLMRPHLLPAELDPTTGAGADRVFPYFIGHQLPPVLSGLLIAALFAAAMSTLDSGINSLSAVMLLDFYRRLRAPDLSGERELKLAKLLTLGFGGVITTAAYAITRIPGDFNLVDLTQKGFNCMVGPLGALFFAGMFLPRCTSRSVVPAALLGVVVGVLLAFWEQLFGTPFSTFWVVPCSCLATFLTAAVLGLLEGAPDAKKPPRMSWSSVVKEDR